MQQLLIATKNSGKFGEICEVLAGPNLKLLSLKDVGLDDEVEETGETHEANAILKAQYFFKKTGLPTLGEDSGIYVDAFHGELGVKTRRWEGLGEATDEEWIDYFLRKMEAVPESERGAKFVCCAAVILSAPLNVIPAKAGICIDPCLRRDDNLTKIFLGETAGTITRELEAPLIPGIPISSCFRPNGISKVYAALSPREKNAVSHRGKAMHAVKAFLEEVS
jgi:XTP/dITP diphosphohydrolase